MENNVEAAQSESDWVDETPRLSFGQFMVKTMSLGMINLNGNTGKVVIKGPITGICNNVKQALDAVTEKDFNRGVWIGKRCLSSASIGHSSFVTETINSNSLHYVVRVNRKTYHLSDVNSSRISNSNLSGGNTVIRVRRCRQPSNHFQWFYKGQTVRNIINVIKIQYSMITSNCIDISKGLYLYARGHLNRDILLALLSNDQFISKTARRMTENLAGEFKNMFKN